MSVFETNTYKQYESEISNLESQVEEMQERIDYLELRNKEIVSKHIPSWEGSLYGNAPWEAQAAIDRYNDEIDENNDELKDLRSKISQSQQLLSRNKKAKDDFVALYGQYISEGYSKSDAEAKAAKKALNTLNPFYLQWWFWVIVAVAIGVPTFLIIRKNLKK